MTPASKAVRAGEIARAALAAARNGHDRKHGREREDHGKSKEAGAAFGWPGIIVMSLPQQ